MIHLIEQDPVPATWSDMTEISPDTAYQAEQDFFANDDDACNEIFMDFSDAPDDARLLDRAKFWQKKFRAARRKAAAEYVVEITDSEKGDVTRRLVEAC